MEMFLRPRNTEVILVLILNSIIFLECSLRCSLEVKEEESHDSTRNKERLKKREDCLIWRHREGNKMWKEQIAAYQDTDRILKEQSVLIINT